MNMATKTFIKQILSREQYVTVLQEPMRKCDSLQWILPKLCLVALCLLFAPCVASAETPDEYLSRWHDRNVEREDAYSAEHSRRVYQMLDDVGEEQSAIRLMLLAEKHRAKAEEREEDEEDERPHKKYNFDDEETDEDATYIYVAPQPQPDYKAQERALKAEIVLELAKKYDIRNLFGRIVDMFMPKEK